MRCKYIFSFLAVLCVSMFTGSFSASAQTQNLMLGKKPYYKSDGTYPVNDYTGKPYSNLTDGDLNTTNGLISLAHNSEKIFFDLGDDSFSIDGYAFKADFTSIDNSEEISFYDKDYKVVKTYNGKISVTDKIAGVRYVSYYGRPFQPMVIREFEVYGRSNKVADVTNLDVKPDVGKVTLSWTNNDSDNFNGVNIYKDNVFLAKVDKTLNSYVADGLQASTTYNFTVKSVDINGAETGGVSKSVTTYTDPKTIPPGSVTSLVAEPSDKSVKLSWTSPKDDDLAGFKVYQNGKQIADLGLQNIFEVKGLTPETEYQFAIVAVDKDNNSSPSVSVPVKTLVEIDVTPPHIPANVFAKSASEALIATWDKVSDADVAGYNVYLDGVKVNNSLVTSNKYTIKNLENGKTYKVQISAVDKNGNESEKSNEAYGYPSANAIPIIESKYELSDLSDGVAGMFGQLWSFLAWYLGIPLAFYVIYKLKQVYLP